MDAALLLENSYKFGLFEFVISAILLCFGSLLITIRLAQTFREAFWIFIASIAIHLGTISEIVSLVEQLNTRAWLCVQFISLPAILLVCRPSRARLIHCRILVESLSEYNVLKHYSVLGPVSKVLIIAILGLVSFSFVSRYLMPIDDFDSKMYHASRVLYWLQNQSIAPYIAHNDRQVAFPFGSELFCYRPVRLTKSELIGKLVFWLKEILLQLWDCTFCCGNSR